jgi:small subunit ribosomal protein S6
MARSYDLFLLLDPAAPDERRAEIRTQVEGLIAKHEGEVLGVHEWGQRQLIYEIDHKTEAEYLLLQFSGEPALIEELDRTLRISDGLIRHRIIRLRAGMPPVPGIPPVFTRGDGDDDDERPRGRRPSYDNA